MTHTFSLLLMVSTFAHLYFCLVSIQNIGDGNGSTAGQDGCERPSKRLHLKQQENQVFVRMKNVASEDQELSTSSNGFVESPQQSFRDGTNHNSRLLHVQHSNSTKQTSSSHSLIKSEVMASRKASSPTLGEVGLGQISIEGLPGKICKKEFSRAKGCSVAALSPSIERTRLGHSGRYSLLYSIYHQVRHLGYSIFFREEVNYAFDMYILVKER